MQFITENRRIILIGLVGLVLICLVGVLAFNVFTGGGGLTSQQAAAPAQTTEEATPAPTEEPTATATRVLQEATSEPTDEPPEEPDAQASAADTEADADAATPAPSDVEADDAAALQPPETPTVTPTAVSVQSGNGNGGVTVGGANDGSGDFTPSQAEDAEPVIGNLLENGDFEEGFAGGVGIGWDSFLNGGAAIGFSPQEFEPLVKSGVGAQRISIADAQEPDRYGGIQQTVQVITGETYTLLLNGHIRTELGSVIESSYGHRMEYALDYSGNTDWRQIPKDEWVELPWDEQNIAVTNVTYQNYAIDIEPPGGQLTLFIRGWHKWATPVLGEYTLDSLSLIGPIPGTVEEPVRLASAPSGEAAPAEPTEDDQMVDNGLPVTGTVDSTPLLSDGRVWWAVLIIGLLVAAAIYRGPWRY